MENEYAKHETDYIRRYQEIGYTDSYRMDGSYLVSMDSKKRYPPEDVNIIKEHRYEGMSNPSDMSILFILETSDGNKGTLLAGFGPSANLELHEFISAIPEENVKDENVLPPDAEK